jgi:hypothetical protein
VKFRRSLVWEIILVAGVFAAMATMGFVNLTEARRAKNEEHARLLIQSFHFAQQQFRNETQSDRDENKKGEFGTMVELLGLKETHSFRRFGFFDVPMPEKVKVMLQDFQEKLAVPEAEAPRELEDVEKLKKVAEKRKKKKEQPTVLFKSPIVDPEKNRLIFDGYAFRVFLPQLAQTSANLSEEEKVAAFTEDAEQYWCAFAWPVRYGRSGTESYFIDFHGNLYACKDPALSEHKSPQTRAIDAYKGREFTSPIKEDVWKPWTAPKPPSAEKPAEKKEEAKKEEQPAAEPGKEGETPADKEKMPPEGLGTPAAKPGSPPPPPGKETDEEKERRKKMIEEAAEETKLKVGDE